MEQSVSGLDKLLIVIWTELGAIIEGISVPDANKGTITLYISVPCSSEFMDTGGKRLCGENLARRVKDSLLSMPWDWTTLYSRLGIEYDEDPAEHIVVKFKRREHMIWTKRAGRLSATMMAREMYMKNGMQE